MDGWIVIPNWDKFQHYKDRHAPWLKDYVDQLDRDEYRELSLSARGLLADVRKLWLRFGGVVAQKEVNGLIGAEARVRTWKELTDAGYVEIVDSKPDSNRASTDAIPEVERDLEIPQTPLPAKRGGLKDLDENEKQRRKAKAWIDNMLPHLEGVDLAYTISDQFKIDDPDLAADLISYAQERMLAR